jgi:Spy/CpxP family protein refolding chaperone
MIRRLILSAAVFALITPAGLFPQRRPAPHREGETWAERRTRDLAARLNLTDAQRQQVLALFTAADKDSAPVDEKLAQARRSLREATKKDAPDAEIEQLAATIGTLTGQLEAIQAKADAAFYKLLTTQQREQFDRRPSSPHRFPHGPARR